MFDLESIKRKLLIKYPFFGSVIANVQYKEDSSVGTAATDGEIIYYNSEFLRNIDLKQQLFVIAHEVCHIAFNHILRSENKNLDLWNTATDAVINAFLMKDGLQITDGMVNMPEAVNYDAEELYEKLLEEENNSCKECNNASDKSRLSNSCSFDDNSENSSNSNNASSDDKDNYFVKSNDSDNNSSNSSNSDVQSSDDHLNESSNKTSDNSKDYSDKKNDKFSNSNHSLWKDSVDKNKENEFSNFTKKKHNDNISEKDAFKKNRDEKKKQLYDIKREIVSESNIAGNDTNEESFSIEETGTLKSIVTRHCSKAARWTGQT